MKQIITSSLVMVLFAVSYAQEPPLAAFDHLIGKTWVGEGTWGDGTPFKQEKTFEFDLNNKIVVARTKGFTDQELTTFGNRNFGIRKVDEKSKKLLFWEFDVFGGLTEGVVRGDKYQLIYVYEYGGSIIADVWEYIDENTYSFSVGSYENGELTQIYLKTEFVRRK